MSAKGREDIHREERALYAYHDGELRGVSRWLFERRLARSLELRRKLEEVERVGDWARECDAEGDTVGFWEVIADGLAAIDAQRAERWWVGDALAFLRAHRRPISAVAATAALALVISIQGNRLEEGRGVISWLDTGGRSVLVLDGQDDATIVWLLEEPVRGAARRGHYEAV